MIRGEPRGQTWVGESPRGQRTRGKSIRSVGLGREDSAVGDFSCSRVWIVRRRPAEGRDGR